MAEGSRWAGGGDGSPSAGTPPPGGSVSAPSGLGPSPSAPDGGVWTCSGLPSPGDIAADMAGAVLRLAAVGLVTGASRAVGLAGRLDDLADAVNPGPDR